MLPGYTFKKYNVLLNYSTEVSKYVTVGTSINMTYKNRQEPPFTGANMALSIYAAGPLYGPFLPDGSGRVASRAYFNEGRNRNPQEYYLMGSQTTKEYNVNAQASIDVKPFKGLVWSTKFAVNYVDEFYKMHQKPYTAYVSQEIDPVTNDYRTAPFGVDILGVTDQYSKAITPTIFSTITYDKTINEVHDLRFLAGYEQISYKYQYLRGRRMTTVDPNISELTGYTNTSESLYFTHPRLLGVSPPSEWAMQSYFGRANYDYKGKYLLEANLRYDGTSKVSPDYRWGLFPSMSAGWLISEENFMKNISWLSSLKLRGSYGTLGNQDIGTYLYQDVLTIANVSYPFGNAAAPQGAVLNVFKDKSLKWESTRINDYGFDLNIKNGLLGVTFDWFRKHTFDILAPQPVPASLGLSSPTLNDGEMRNQGIDLELSHQNKIGEFTYGVNFLISTAHNELLKIKAPSKVNGIINEVGLPYGSYYLLEWDGIFQVEDIGNPLVPVHALNTNPKAGDLKMKDQNKDGKVDDLDRIVVNGAYPDYIYSFGFNAGYKNFTLTAFFQGVEGLKTRLNNWGVDPFQQGTAPDPKFRNAWTPENRSNTVPAIYIAGYPGVANYQYSTYYLQDASYLRLKNIMLSYDFPRELISRIKAKELNVYVSADNLVTFTKFKGGDPERTSLTGNLAQYPQARILNIGLNVKF
jgi:TonB-linked SusC/RagA family outer membrane protein